ncbi:MAG: PQQ-binding-like beta-propeller repeat protein [Bacteroidales bacterium]|nr:PQQ-binding-like beta-propeller repeat protein [Bacteroidales bacterium]
MKTISKIAIAAGILVLASCSREPKIVVHASFETDKTEYEVNEDIKVVNTSYAENGQITSCKWECGSTVSWTIQPKPFNFSSEGDAEIKLTAIVYTDKKNYEGVCTKTVKIRDTNIRPVADFSYSPTEIIAGESVQFTDKSTDADGEIVAWEWTFGTTVSTEQNPKFTFTAFGEIPVSLVVTDDKKGTAKKTVVVNVQKNPYSLELKWEQPYDDNDAFVKFTSPAMSVDGSTIYVFSSGYNLVAFDTDGNKKWTFDANKRNPNPYQNNKTKDCTSGCPTVDPATGNILVAVGYNELDYKATVGKNESGVYCITPDGKEGWYFAYGNARYINVVPVVIGDYVFLSTKYNPEQANYPDMWATYGNQDNAHILKKSDGSFHQMLQLKQGNYGGTVAFSSNNYIFTHCNDGYGGRVFFQDSANHWKYLGAAANQGSPKALGAGYESGASSQMAIHGTKVYILYTVVASAGSGVSTPSVVYCYDAASFIEDGTTKYNPDWVCGVQGSNSRYSSDGIAIGQDGTLYVTTSTSGDDKGRLTAITPSGTIKWSVETDNDIAGSPAIDDKGYIYYHDSKAGKLVMVEAENGSKVSEIVLASSLRSSPTIGKDGTIYCVGDKNGCPTLFAVKGIATGHGSNWSQLGGNPQKTCVK